jgi:hypothetical protein
MTPENTPPEKKLSNTAIRIGIIVSGITVLTTFWTTAIAPVLGLQSTVGLMSYRLAEAEKDIARLQQEITILHDDKRQRTNQGQPMTYRKNP